MLDTLEKIQQKINNVIESMSALCIIIMTVIVSVQIVTRYFLSFSIPWAEEITKLFMVWYALLCVSILHYEDKHVAVTIFFEKFNDKIQLIIKLVLNLLVLLFSIVLFYTGIVYTLANMNVILPASGWNRFWLYVPLPIMGILLIYSCIVLIIRNIMQIQGKIPYIKKEWGE